uniref:Uncharacterized protein n=1 Tax=Amphimedon queenslandica TaxID=400682 RepID=A0A1X7SQ42_AMPQE
MLVTLKLSIRDCYINVTVTGMGEWKPKQIDNPAYKGEWVLPEVPNSEYEADSNLYKYEDFGVIGIDIWQLYMCYTMFITCNGTPHDAITRLGWFIKTATWLLMLTLYLMVLLQIFGIRDY